jgi:hypothetical protein
MGARWRVLVLVGLATLAACGSSPAIVGGEPTDAQTSGAQVHLDPLTLWGSWQVEAAGEEPGAVLQLGTPPWRAHPKPEPLGHELRLWRRCGAFLGGWTANTAGMFLGSIDGLAHRCPNPGGLDRWTPVWLRHAVGYRVDDNAPVLLDAVGRIVARLLPGGLPTPNTKLIMAEEAEPPVLDDQMRKALTEPEGEPSADMEPATPEELVGRWVPPKGTGANPAVFLELTADGTIRTNDGCNYGVGRWLADDSGRILAIGGPTTLVGCGGLRPVAAWLAAASYALFDGPTLVLFDSAGTEGGRLVRETR